MVNCSYSSGEIGPGETDWMSAESKKTLSTQEVADRLGVTSRAIIKWVRKGLFPGAYKLNPHASNSPYRIPVEAVEKFEQEREEAAPTPDQ